MIMRRSVLLLFAWGLWACSGGSSAPGAPELPATLPPSEVVATTPLAGVVLAPLGQPRILLSHAPTVARLQAMLASGAASATRFRAYVDAQLQGSKAYGFEPWHAALLGPLTQEARYCQWAVKETEQFVQAEEARVESGQRLQVEADSYLEVGPHIGNLALVMDWCRPHTTAAQRQRWLAYANQAVWNVWHPDQARWGSRLSAWSGWSVDNPANNYYYSFLEATMMLGLATHGENEQAQNWLETFRLRKLEDQLVPVFNRDLQGGGSREGTGYGTAMMKLWRLFDWWEKSTGQRLAELSPHTRASLTHFMHNVAPTLDRLAPTGDHARDSTAALFDYHRHYLQLLARLFPAEPAAGIARSLLAASSVQQMQYGFMRVADFLDDLGDIPALPLNRLATAHWGAGTGQFAMRSDWTPQASYANFICGPYTESHAHRDQGSFVIFKDRWWAQDANLDSHSGIEQAESLHNLVRFERAGQAITQTAGSAPCAMQALADDDAFSYASARITPLYAADSGVARAEREFVFLKPDVWIVFDRAQATAGTTRLFTLNLPAAPTLAGDRLSLAAGNRTFHVQRLAPTGLPWQVQAWPGLNSEVNSGVRVQALETAGEQSLFLHVLSFDDAVVSAVAEPQAGATAVTLQLRDGRRIAASFAHNQSGGQLEIRAANGQVVRSGALPNTVNTPPWYR
jgi:hypothetical protein